MFEETRAVCAVDSSCSCFSIEPKLGNGSLLSTGGLTLLKGAKRLIVMEGVALNTPIERGSDARLGGVHFFGPPRFGPFGTFLVVFSLNWGMRLQITLGSPL